MKKFILKTWYNVLYQFDQHRNEIPDWWYGDKPFDSLPRHIQRIKVAKDVLAQMEIGRYKAFKGNYIRYIFSQDGGRLTYTNDDIKSNFENIKNCDVCALGACLLSTTKFKNKLKFNEVDHAYFEDAGSKVQELLLTIFTPLHLAVIEGAFEGGYRDTSSVRVAKHLIPSLRINRSDISEELEIRIKEFYYNYDNSNQRLTAIMQNIIANKGEFKP